MKTVTFSAATSRTVQIPIGDGARRLLRHRDRKWIKVTTAAVDETGTSYAKTSKTLDDAS
jgi:hypothetical protein